MAAATDERNKTITARIQRNDVLKAVRSEFDQEKFRANPLVLRITPPICDGETYNAELFRETDGRYPSGYHPIHIRAISPHGLIDRTAHIPDPPTWHDALEGIQEHERIENPCEERIERVLKIYNDEWQVIVDDALRNEVVLRNGTKIEIEYVDE